LLDVLNDFHKKNIVGYTYKIYFRGK